jgi:NAD(P)-dependent dehydrogenase (short-subunit alcohol dehydrogenase family)
MSTGRRWAVLLTWRPRRVMQVNLFGSWRMIQAFLLVLKRSAHPRIVNVSRAAPAPTPIRPSASHSEAARQRRMESAKLL